MINDIIKIMKEAGNILLKEFDLNGREGFWNGTQYHAKADNLIHNFIKKEIENLVPSYPVLSEEDISSKVLGKGEDFWILDPIDGTASYAEGYSGYVTQIALIKSLKPVLSVIYAPKLDELYCAELNEGSYKNNKKLKCNISKNLTLIDNYPNPNGIAKKIIEDLNINKYIECGSLGLKICKIADNTANIFIKDVVVRDWDIAPPSLILSEANGCLKKLNSDSFEYTGHSKHKGIIATSDKKLNNLVYSLLN